MTEIVIGLASNTPDCIVQMKNAIKWINDIFSDCRCSEIYETEATRGAKGTYLNAVAKAMTDLDCLTVNKLLKECEKAAGRTPEMKLNHIVPLDLDLVMYDHTVLRPADMACEYFMKGYRQIV